MKPGNKNKNSLTPNEKRMMIALCNDYRRVLRRQLHAHQELLMLHMDLIPMLADNPAYDAYVKRWAELIKTLQYEKSTGANNG